MLKTSHVAASYAGAGMWLGSAGKHDAIQVCLACKQEENAELKPQCSFKGMLSSFQEKISLCHLKIFEQAGISKECFLGHLERKKMSCSFVVEEIVDRGKWVGPRSVLVTKLGTKMRCVSSPHLSPPPSLYLYLKQVCARTKNSSLLF